MCEEFPTAASAAEVLTVIQMPLFVILFCYTLIFFFLLCFTYFSFQERHVTVSVWKSGHKKPFFSPRGSEGSQVGRLGSKHHYLLSPLAGPLPYLLIELGAN